MEVVMSTCGCQVPLGLVRVGVDPRRDAQLAGPGLERRMIGHLDGRALTVEARGRARATGRARLSELHVLCRPGQCRRGMVVGVVRERPVPDEVCVEVGHVFPRCPLPALSESQSESQSESMQSQSRLGLRIELRFRFRSRITPCASQHPLHLDLRRLPWQPFVKSESQLIQN